MQAKPLQPVSWDGLTEDKFIPVTQQKHVVWLAVHVEISGSLMPPAEMELWKVSSASLLVFPSLFVDVSTREASVRCGLLCSFICLCSSSRSLALTHRSNNSLCFLACFFSPLDLCEKAAVCPTCYVIASDFPLVALTCVQICCHTNMLIS